MRPSRAYVSRTPQGCRIRPTLTLSTTFSQNRARAASRECSPSYSTVSQAYSAILGPYLPDVYSMREIDKGF